MEARDQKRQIASAGQYIKMSVFSPREFVDVGTREHAGPRVDTSTINSRPRPLAAVSRFQLLVGQLRAPYGLRELNGEARAALTAVSLGRNVPVGGFSKRLFDIALASVALVLLAPLLLALAAAIKLVMGGAVTYAHERVGFSGRRFKCLKFRTMVADSDEVLKNHLQSNPEAAAEWRRTRKLAKDPRVTRLGMFLRKTSLDELPQFINILRGDMSCVGPRPVVSEELELYSESVFDYLRARPGVTGLWQVSGRSSASYDDRVKFDSEYVSRWSFRNDLSILFRTLPAILKFKHAS
jgi:exopolysaccharide production protein ExoY